MRAAYIVTLALALGMLPAFAAADPSDAPGPFDVAQDRHPEPDDAPRFDYSRFSDGPRRVPTPRGPSLERARRLGLGTREAASQLFRHGPSPEQRRAAGWRGQPVQRLLWPIDEGRYVRGYGYVRTTRPDLIHNGVDIGAPEGTTVRAAADGIVAYSDNGIRGYGNTVLIVHPNGWFTLYAHCARTTVQAGWRVRRGERIAIVGSTGISRGPHLHFELHADGDPTNPLALFDGGPAHVRRVAERAADAGTVPPPAQPTADDLPSHPPLAPWRDGDAQPATAQAPASELFRELGDPAIARRLLRFRPTEALTRAAGGRTFRNLLWPARGGSLSSHDDEGARIWAEPGTAVRAAADGLVVFAGSLGERGESVVIVHPTGWVTIYGGLDRIAVRAGDHVERGAWIARTTTELRFEARVEGRRVDPATLLTSIPR